MQNIDKFTDISSKFLRFLNFLLVCTIIIYRVVLNPNMKTLQHNCNIDLRNFNNFQLSDYDGDNLEELGIKVKS